MSQSIIIEDYLAEFWTSDEEDYHQPSFDTPEEEREYFLEHITDEEYNAIFAPFLRKNSKS